MYKSGKVIQENRKTEICSLFRNWGCYLEPSYNYHQVSRREVIRSHNCSRLQKKTVQNLSFFQKYLSTEITRVGKLTKINIIFHHYRPHFQRNAGRCFHTGVCPFTGGYSSSRFFPRSQIPGSFQGVPPSWSGGTPDSGSFPGLWS